MLSNLVLIAVRIPGPVPFIKPFATATNDAIGLNGTAVEAIKAALTDVFKLST